MKIGLATNTTHNEEYVVFSIAPENKNGYVQYNLVNSEVNDHNIEIGSVMLEPSRYSFTLPMSTRGDKEESNIFLKIEQFTEQGVLWDMDTMLVNVMGRVIFGTIEFEVVNYGLIVASIDIHMPNYKFVDFLLRLNGNGIIRRINDDK